MQNSGNFFKKGVARTRSGPLSFLNAERAVRAQGMAFLAEMRHVSRDRNHRGVVGVVFRLGREEGSSKFFRLALECFAECLVCGDAAGEHDGFRSEFPRRADGFRDEYVERGGLEACSNILNFECGMWNVGLPEIPYSMFDIPIFCSRKK